MRGYGPDQALLKLKRVYREHPTPVVFFGFTSENVNRIVNVYRWALDVQTYHTPLGWDGTPFFEGTRPRFLLQDGSLVLLPNPVWTREELRRLIHDPSVGTVSGGSITSPKDTTPRTSNRSCVSHTPCRSFAGSPVGRSTAVRPRTIRLYL